MTVWFGRAVFQSARNGWEEIGSFVQTAFGALRYEFGSGAGWVEEDFWWGELVLDDRGVRGGCCCHRGESLALEHMFWSVLLMRLFRTWREDMRCGW